MKHVKEFFNFRNKESKTWKEKFDSVYGYYLSVKKNGKMESLKTLDVSIYDDNRFGVSIGLSPHLVFYKNNPRRNDGPEVIDFDVCDYSKPDSEKGVYKITEEEYNSCLKKAEEINDWLDKLSDETFNKSDISIEDFEFDKSDLAIDDINFELKKQLFNKYINKEFEFEISYHLWTSESKNTREVERHSFKIKDITVGFGGDRFYCQIWIDDILGDPSYMWIESNTKSEYLDLEKNKLGFGTNLIKMDKVKKEKSRREERESWKKKDKYPMVISYETTPCKYDTIEFIKEITELLTQLNDGVKNNNK